MLELLGKRELGQSGAVERKGVFGNKRKERRGEREGAAGIKGVVVTQQSWSLPPPPAAAIHTERFP